jgi:hypothetical protein
MAIQSIEQACMALQGGDTQGAMMQLDLALSQLRGGTQGGTQGNMTGEPVNSSPSAGSLTGGQQGGGGGTTTGGGGGEGNASGGPSGTMGGAAGPQVRP